MTKDVTLDALVELRAKATPGPWTVFDDTRPGIDSAAEDGPNIIYAARFTCEYGGVGRVQDAAFIAAAGSFDFASLAAELTRLRKLREAARAMWYAHVEDELFRGPPVDDPYGQFELALVDALARPAAEQEGPR